MTAGGTKGHLRRALLATWMLCAALGVAACGSINSKSDGESLIKDWVKKNGKGRVTVKAVSCPSGVSAKAGKTYDCTATLDIASIDVKYRVTVHYASDSKIEMRGSDLHPQA